MNDFWYLIKTDRIILAFLLILSLSGYFLIGLTWSTLPAFDEKDFFFKADVTRVIGDITEPNADHARTKVHPLFVIFFNPLGFIVAQALGSNVLAAILANAFFGSLSILFYYLILRGSTLSRLHACLFSFLLGASASHIVFGSIPETLMFSSASLLLLFLLYRFFDGHRRFLYFFIPASIFSFGITTTNLVLSAILLFFVLIQSRWTSAIIRMCLSILVIIIVAVGISLLQKYIYPSSTMFLAKFPYSEELNWVSSDLIQKPIVTLAKSLPVFFLYNIIAPETLLVDTGDKQFVTISRSVIRNLNFLRSVATLLYAWLVSISLYLAIKNKLFRDKMFLPSILYLSFVVAFHLIYGRRELFLYSPLYTFPYFLVLALPFGETTKTISTSTSLVLILLCLGTLINNILFVMSISDALSHFPFS